MTSAPYRHHETFWWLTLPGQWPARTRVEAVDLEAVLADLRTRYTVVRKTFTLDNYTITRGERPSGYVGDQHRYGHVSRVDTYRPAVPEATCGGCGAASDEECSPSCLSWEELAEARKRL